MFLASLRRFAVRAELLPVGVGLFGVGLGEADDGLLEAVAGADVAGEDAGVAGAGVAAGEDLSTDGGVLAEVFGFEFGDVERGLVVVELADEVVEAVDARPAEHGVGLDLHGALAVGGALALVAWLGGVLEVGSPGGADLLLDLQEERVFSFFCLAAFWAAAVAFEVDAEVAQTDGAGADDLEGDGERAELG